MIRHILRDGKETDITGHIVRQDDVKAVYQILERIRYGNNSQQKQDSKGGRKILL